MKAERLKVLTDLRGFYEKYDARFPAWYRKLRARARKIYEDFER